MSSVPSSEPPCIGCVLLLSSTDGVVRVADPGCPAHGLDGSEPFASTWEAQSQNVSTQVHYVHDSDGCGGAA